MQDLLTATRQVEGEDGCIHEFAYSILVDQMEVEPDFFCESYGVRVEERDGDAAEAPNITVRVERIDALMDLLIRNAVSPVGLRDVVEDWL